MMKNYTVETYKGFGIDFDLYDMGEYTVHYCGDDLFFPTIWAARNFIDSIAD